MALKHLSLSVLPSKSYPMCLRMKERANVTGVTIVSTFIECIQTNLFFRSPCAILLTGPTMSAKCTLTRQIVENRTTLFKPAPKRIVHARSVWRMDFTTLQSNNIKFVRGLETIMQDDGFLNPKTPTLIILDDRTNEICDNKKATALFTRDLHHRNVTVLFLSKTLFKQGRWRRDIALNCQYIILYWNLHVASSKSSTWIDSRVSHTWKQLIMNALRSRVVTFW